MRYVNPKGHQIWWALDIDFQMTGPLTLHLAHICLHWPSPAPPFSGFTLLPTPYILNTLRLPQTLFMNENQKKNKEINMRLPLGGAVSPSIHLSHLPLQYNTWFLAGHMTAWNIVRDDMWLVQANGIETEVPFWQCLGISTKMYPAWAICPLSSLSFSPSCRLVDIARVLATILMQEVKGHTVGVAESTLEQCHHTSPGLSISRSPCERETHFHLV